MSGCLLHVHVFVWGGFGVVFFFLVCDGFSFFLPGTDFLLKKHSNQRGGFTDTVLRVRSASIIKMVNTGHRQERLRRVSFSRFFFPISCPFFFCFFLGCCCCFFFSQFGSSPFLLGLSLGAVNHHNHGPE
jgi:hypothetical protein